MIFPLTLWFVTTAIIGQAAALNPICDQNDIAPLKLAFTPFRYDCPVTGQDWPVTGQVWGYYDAKWHTYGDGR